MESAHKPVLRSSNHIELVTSRSLNKIKKSVKNGEITLSPTGGLMMIYVQHCRICWHSICDRNTLELLAIRFIVHNRIRLLKHNIITSNHLLSTRNVLLRNGFCVGSPAMLAVRASGNLLFVLRFCSACHFFSSYIKWI